MIPLDMKRWHHHVSQPDETRVYILVQKKETLRKHCDMFFDLIKEFVARGENARGGALRTENMLIVLPTHEVFVGYAYREDMESWGRIVDAYCKRHNRLRAELHLDGTVSIADGRRYTREECAFLDDVDLSFRVV
ncbi:MAG TPA: hypothetical protein PKC45_18855 [Gemmatales bacterium]|nr:hypothetical protein [Gemmatales bacterium]